MRKIENSDLWSAIRGLGIWSMSQEERDVLQAQHIGKDIFASLVIVEACKQVSIAKRAIN